MTRTTRSLHLLALIAAAVALHGFTSTMAWAGGWNLIGGVATIAALLTLSAVALRSIVALTFGR